MNDPSLPNFLATDQSRLWVPAFAAALGDRQAAGSGQGVVVQPRHPRERGPGLPVHPLRRICSSHTASAQTGPGAATHRGSATFTHLRTHTLHTQDHGCMH